MSGMRVTYREASEHEKATPTLGQGQKEINRTLHLTVPL